jgi:hypothetical protein
VFGAFDFNKTPLAPPGTRVLVHERPDVQQSWDPRALDVWYIGPAMHHYRCYWVYTWGTQSERITDTLVWFPTCVKMPTMSSLDLALAAAQDLLMALMHPSPGSPLAPTTDSQTAALKQLVEIFHSPGSPLAPTTDSQTAALKQLVEIFQVCTQRSPLLAANDAASTAEVLEIDKVQQTTQLHPAPSPRVDTNTTTPMVPPGFQAVPTTHPSLQPTTTTTATLPRVPTTEAPSSTPTPVAPNEHGHAEAAPPRQPLRLMKIQQLEPHEGVSANIQRLVHPTPANAKTKA